MNKENPELTKLLARAQLHLQSQEIEDVMPFVKEWITQSYNIGFVDGATIGKEKGREREQDEQKY